MRRSGPLKAKTALRTKKPITRTRRKDTPGETKAAVLARDGNCKARFSGDSACAGSLHVHHILPRGRGGGHEMTNLIAVCRAHHDYIHAHPAWAKANGLLS